MESYIIYACDTETTGMNEIENDIIEISFLRFYFNDPDKIEQKTWLLTPININAIRDDALAKNGHKKEDILWQTAEGKQNYKKPKDVLPEIEMWIAEDGHSAYDRVFAGQNPLFDFNFQKQLWIKNNAVDTFPFETGPNLKIIDTKQLILMIDIILGQKRDKYSLSALIKDFGIKKEKAHRADADVRMTKDLLVHIINGMRKSAEENFSIKCT